MTDTLENKRCAIYARFSCDRQRDASIEDQVRRCRQYIEQRGGVFDPALVFSDFAISGASLQRPAFEALLNLVESNPRGVDVIVVEDQSRLSRDFADAGQLFKKMKYAQVRLLGVGDGIDTDSRSSKLTFGIKALVADIYRDDLADKTRRGLEGRVRNGYSAGGLAFGFKSAPENDAEGRLVGFKVSVDEEAARVVKRIFDLYLDGGSLAGIAHALNAEGVPPPRARTKHRRKGWVAGTIRAMLRNQRYRGIWTFGEREWVHVPDTNKRRPRRRDDADIIRVERPELQIIDPLTWQAVQDRMAGVLEKYTRTVDGRPKGRAIPMKRTKYLLSGILTCGQCGAPMIITGSTRGKLEYRCADHLKRGTCSSRLAVREEEAREAVVSEVLAVLSDPERTAFLHHEVARQLRAASGELDKERRARELRLKGIEEQIGNLVDSIARGNESPAVLASLQEREAEAARERLLLLAMEKASPVPVRLPSASRIVARVRDLRKILEGDPNNGREALRKHLGGGELRVERVSTRECTIRGELIPVEYLRDSSRGEKNEKFPGLSSGGWI